MGRAGWRILSQEPGRSLDAQTAGALLDIGERVTVQFRGDQVFIASICDPSIGFSLAGRRHCAAHREFVRAAMLAESADTAHASVEAGEGAA